MVAASTKEATIPISEVLLAGIPTAVASRRELAELVIASSLARRKGASQGPARTMFDLNGHAIWMAARDPSYAAALKVADLVHADGQSVIFASRLLTDPAVAERSATTDLIHDIAAQGVSSGIRFFLLGAKEDVNAKAAEVLQTRYPDLQIAGRRNGYFTPEETPEVIEHINSAKPDIVWLGLGKPQEQLFACEHRGKIDAAWIITCGGCLDFLAGNYTRAPELLQRLGLEWVHRMVTGPRYLIKRYATSNLVAAWLLLTRTRRKPLAQKKRFSI